MMWSTRFETTHGLVWDPDRMVWVTEDGGVYDGDRFSEFARGSNVA
jgi:hypothetical protein